MFPRPKQNVDGPTQKGGLLKQLLNDSRFIFKNAESSAGLRPAVCRVCLSTNVRLHHMSEPGLSAMYAGVVGVQINSDDKLPRHLCWECVARMASANRFRQKALTAQWILTEKITNSRLITISDIELIDKAQHKLGSTLGTKCNTGNEYDFLFTEETVEPNNYNYYNSKSNYNKDKHNYNKDICEVEISFCKEEPVSIKEELTSEENPSNNEQVLVHVKVEALDNYTSPYENAEKEVIVPENVHYVRNMEENKSDEEVLLERGQENREIDVLLEDIVTDNADQSTESLRQKINTEPYTPIKKESIVEDDLAFVTELPVDYVEAVINDPGSSSHNMNRSPKIPLKKKKLISGTNNPQKLVVCDICDKSFHGKPSLIQHLQQHPKIHYCTYCSYKGSKKKILLKHINVKHTRSEVFNCPHCSYKAYQKWDLSVHINAKHTKTISFDCPHCSYTAYRKGHLTTHINTKHTKSEVFTCNQCSYKAYRKSLLSRHLNVKHNKNILHECSHCKYKAFSKSELLRHVNAKHEKIKMFNCPHCNYNAYQKSDLSKHINAKHTKSEVFKCPHCSFETYMKSGLVKHLNNKHAQ